MSTASLAQTPPRLTREEYLAFEREAETRHELHDGELFPVEAATRNHSRLSLRLGSIFDAALKGRPCEPLGMDVRVRIPGRDRYKYPDLSVACPPEFEDEQSDILVNPTVLFEVLSPSMERYDRGGKFQDYAWIPSFKEYVLVSQDEVLVEQRTRQEGGWFLRLLRQGDLLHLESIGTDVPIAAIYDGILL